MTRSNVMQLTGFSALISVLALRALSFSFSAIHFRLAGDKQGWDMLRLPSYIFTLCAV